MSRDRRLAFGIALVLGVVILWLLLRGQKTFAGDDVKLGDIFFGGYEPGSFVLMREPDQYSFSFDLIVPPSQQNNFGSDSPCACGCEEIKFNFLDLTDWVKDYNAALYSQVTGEIQEYFSYNPWAYTFANSNRIDQFASEELYRPRRGPLI